MFGDQITYSYIITEDNQVIKKEIKMMNVTVKT